MREDPINFPLTENQREIWLAAQAGEDASLVFNQTLSIQFCDGVSAEVLCDIVQQLVNRHDALRTTFAPDGSCQRIFSSGKIHIATQDLSALADSDQERKVAEAVRQEEQTPFDLANGPLFRAQVLKLSRNRHVLVLGAHHIVLDGWSRGVLLREIDQLCDAFNRGTVARLGPAMQIQDYVQWRNASANQAIFAAAEAYWLRQFTNPPSDLELPSDRPRPPLKTYCAAEKEIVLDSVTYKALKQAAAASDCTLFGYLLAGLTACLFRLTGQGDLVVGIPVAGQPAVGGQPGNKSLVGHCVNTLALRSCCEDHVRFSDHLKITQGLVFDALQYQSFTLGSLVRKLELRTDPSRAPLIPVVFNFIRANCCLPLSKANVVSPPKTFVFFDLVFDAHDSGEDIRLVCRYNTDLFDGARIERLLRHYEALLKAAVAGCDRKLSELSWLTEAERHQIVVEWNRTEAAYPEGRCLHQLVEEQVEKTPKAVAVEFGGNQLTYRELNNRANQLARHLQKLGIGPDSLVGLYAERSLEMVIGLLGILKAGGAYVPMDPEYPKERLAFMLEDSAVKVLLTQRHLVPALPFTDARLICLDADWPTIAQESQANPEIVVKPENLAYMIYTSGSTGKPKGAMNTHRGIVNRLWWMQEAYQLTCEDRILQKTPFSFDVSVWEFFWPLLAGAGLVVAKPGGHRDAEYLAQVIAKDKITTLHFVPSMLQVFLEQSGLRSACVSLKRVICSGEALPIELERRFFSILGAKLHNLYGPTEASVDVTYWACRRDNRLKTVPIGRPIANTQIFILDKHLQPVPVGVPGELHIGGIGLARGYHNRPELTAEKFISNPFSNDSQSRLYKTGDLARYMADGSIEFLGRLDFQVKIRGNRVELGEVEAVLNRHPDVQASVVMAREDVPGEKRLVGYLVKRNGAIKLDTVREYLSGKLPDYMVPRAFVTLDALPLSPNGKVDRKALPKPETGTTADRFVPPQTPTEIALAKIWHELLDAEQIGVHDNYFDLGGHSLQAIRLISIIRKYFGRTLPLAAIFEAPTIAQFSKLLDGNNSPAPNASKPFRGRAGGTPLFYIPGIAGYEFLPPQLESKLRETCRFYDGFQYPGLDGKLPLPERVEDIAAHLVNQIRSIWPSGPCSLAGWSFGGVMAYEVACQLANQGRRVEFVFLLDSRPPGVRLRRRPISEILGLFRRHLAGMSRQDRISFFCKLGFSKIKFLYQRKGRWLDAERKEEEPPMIKSTRLASCKFEPRSYESGPVVLFQIDDWEFYNGFRFAMEPDFGWGKYVKHDLKIVRVPGNHFSMLEEPGLSNVAEKMINFMRQGANPGAQMGISHNVQTVSVSSYHGRPMEKKLTKV